MEEIRESKMVITVTDEGVGFDLAGTNGEILKKFSQLVPAMYKTILQMGDGDAGCEGCEDSEGCEDKGKYPQTRTNRADAFVAMALSMLMSEIPKESYFARKGESKIRELLTGFIIEDMLGKRAG